MEAKTASAFSQTPTTSKMQDSSSSAAATLKNSNQKRSRTGKKESKGHNKFLKIGSELNQLQMKLFEMVHGTVNYLPIKPRERGIVSVALVQDIKKNAQELLALASGPSGPEDSPTPREAWKEKSEDIQKQEKKVLKTVGKAAQRLGGQALALSVFADGSPWVSQMARTMRDAATNLQKLEKHASTVGSEFPVDQLQAHLHRMLEFLDPAMASCFECKCIIGCCEELLDELADLTGEEDQDEEDADE
jgi:hypothetical protein